MRDSPASGKRGDALAVLAHGVPTAALMLQGLLYLVTPTFMPYHADALGTTWEALPPHYRVFLLGVIKVMGAGSFAVALALAVIVLVPLRRGEMWARWAVPLVGTTYTGLMAYAAYTIDARTAASTPWRLTCVLTASYLLGAALSYWPGRTTGS